MVEYDYQEACKEAANSSLDTAPLYQRNFNTTRIQLAP
jgi:hypothetical protein